MVIAIDGTAGSGKSTLAKRIAARLGFRYIDSGAMYRVVGLCALRAGILPDDEEALSALAAGLRIEFESAGESLRVLANGVDVTEAIRSPEASRASSAVAVFRGVRRALVEKQRRLGGGGDTVIEGRDIGTVVFPEAEIKFYLDADAGIRAERRKAEQDSKGIAQPSERVLEEISARDRRDSSRDASPLRPAGDAVVIDTTNRSLDEMEQLMLSLIRERLDHLPPGAR